MVIISFVDPKVYHFHTTTQPTMKDALIFIAELPSIYRVYSMGISGERQFFYTNHELAEQVLALT